MPARRSLLDGIVTFLLTDIEGSTVAWENDSELMNEEMARHDEVVHRAVVRHGGIRPIEQGEGDSIVAAFTHPADAIRAAIDVQQQLFAEERTSCRVRMAIHTGQALVRVDADLATERYAGPSIIRAARLRSCAHGGQVLVSGTTASLVGATLPADAGLRDLGSVVLRGLTEPEPVHQLLHPDLPDQFPPLRSLENTPHTIPAPATPFLGRTRDIDNLTALITEHRLVTVTGTGGIGKTRLAQRCAGELLEAMCGGVWWVELAPASTVEGVEAALAEGMKLALAPGAPSIDQFAHHLAAHDAVLLVLDNCEHVIESAGDLIVQLMVRCPNLHVVTTSREPFGLPGEHVWRVASLSVPPTGGSVTADELQQFDATRLFIERGRAARPNLVIDDTAALQIAAICIRLDGVALAIELAAARARAMPLDALAQGLDSAFRLLTGGSRTLLPRQQTLLASIAWSVDLLSDTQQTTLIRLAICPGPFDLDAAEAIAADGTTIHRFDVLDALTALVDKSLIEFDPATNSYRVLETIRQFSLDRLSNLGDVGATRRRHAEHWAERFSTIEAWRLDLTTLVRSQLADAMAMLDWAMIEEPAMAERVLGAAGWIYGFGRWAELPRACAFLTAQRQRGPAWPMAVATVGTIAPLAGQFDLFAFIDEAVQQATAAGDRNALHALAVGQAYVGIIVFDPRPAMQLFDEAVAEGHTAAAFYAGTAVSILLVSLGWLDEAERVCTWVRDVSRVGDAVDQTAAGCALARAMSMRGCLDVSGDIPEKVDSWAMVSNMYAATAAHRAVYAADRSALQRAIGLCKPDAMTGRPDVAVPLTRWAEAVLDDDIERALQALSVIATDDSPLVVATIAAALGGTQAALARWDDAARTADAIEAIWSSQPLATPLPTSTVSLLRARIAIAREDRATADRCAHDALTVATDAGLHLISIDALETVGAVALLAGDPIRATRLAGAAHAERQRCGYRAQIWTGLTSSRSATLCGEHPDAWSEGLSLPFHVATAMAQRQRGPRGRPSFGYDALTPTELLVAGHIADGRTNAEVASSLLISVTTVKTHVTRIFTKLGVRNRAEVAATMPRRDG